VILEFSRKNNLHPDLSEEMLGRWRREIPELLEKKSKKKKDWWDI